MQAVDSCGARWAGKERSYGKGFALGLGDLLGFGAGLIDLGGNLITFGGAGSWAIPGSCLSATKMSNRLLDSLRMALVTPKLRTALNPALTSGDT